MVGKRHQTLSKWLLDSGPQSYSTGLMAGQSSTGAWSDRGWCVLTSRAPCHRGRVVTYHTGLAGPAK